MYRDKRIALVIPAYNEEKLIRPTLEHLPELIDRAYVVDDVSPDRQNEVILDCAAKDGRITLLKHEINQGPGGAIITGYRQAAADDYDIVLVVGGDYQMNLEESPCFLDAIIDGKCDYAKGNRFFEPQLTETMSHMPKVRIVGNTIISALTKIASGYYKTMDVVDGYTAITREAIRKIDWNRAWKRYGYPMDFLIRLNAYGCRVADVPRTAIYLPGERQSQIKGVRYALRVTPMLIRGFFWRLNYKYLYRDFHPLVFFYYLGVTLLPLGLLFGMALTVAKIMGHPSFVTGSRAILCALLVITGLQFLLFGMLFDMNESNHP